MAKQTHLFLKENDRMWMVNVRAVDVACGKGLVDPANAERDPAYVGCQKCLGHVAVAFNDFGRGIYGAVVAAKVLVDPDVQRATAALKGQLDDAIRMMEHGLADAKREAAGLDRAVEAHASGSGLIGPLDVAMHLPRSAANALNNIRTDLLASYGAALEAEITRVRKEA